jgi:hypothetical protein
VPVASNQIKKILPIYLDIQDDFLYDFVSVFVYVYVYRMWICYNICVKNKKSLGSKYWYFMLDTAVIKNTDAAYHVM